MDLTFFIPIGSNSFTKKKCPSPSKCRPIVQCGAYLSPNQLTSSSRSCTQDNGETGVCCERFTRNKSKLTCPMFHRIAYLPFILDKCAHLFRSSELFAFSGALPPCYRQDQRSRRARSCRSRGRLFCQNTECDKQVGEEFNERNLRLALENQ